MKTYTTKQTDIKRSWYLVDAKDKTLGRLAAKIAAILRGKNKPIFSPYVDTGDYCVVVNAKYIKLTGKKSTQKVYDKYTGYPSGRKEITFDKMLIKKPIFALSTAVKGMLPKNTLGKQMFRKLKVYAEAEHENRAQNPKPITLQ